MTWLVTPQASQPDLADRIRQRVSQSPALIVPGAFDALSGLIAREVGAEVLYLSGAGYSASRGLPDAGLVTSSEVTDRARDIVRATALPLIVDIDTGYGSPLAAARAARELAESGVAAIQVEDQTLPKACGHLEVQTLAPLADAISVIHAIREAAPTMFVIARTDARTVEGLPEAIRRSSALLQAGADMIFPEALRTREEFSEVRAAVDGALLANMTEFGKSPALTAADFDQLGYSAVLFPVSALRVAAQACRRLYRTLFDQGTTAPLLDEMLTRSDLYELLEYSRYSTLDSIVQEMLSVHVEPRAIDGTAIKHASEATSGEV